MLQVSADSHPDLFWALRGGGGNFGVVTNFRYRLHPVTEAYGGLLGYPADRAVEALQAYRHLAAEAPDQLALNAGLVTAPAAPFVPDRLRGQPVVGLLPVYFGSATDGERALRPLRAFAPAAIDLTGPMPYLQVQQQTDGFVAAGTHHYYTAEWLDDLDDHTIDALVAAAFDAPSPQSVVILKAMGGATARIPADATPFAYRHATHNLDIHAQYPAGEAPEPHLAWTRAVRRAAQSASAGGGYVNFIAHDQGPDRVRAAYGDNYHRLTQIKAAYDPDNVFHINHNIPPAPATPPPHSANAATGTQVR